MVHDVEVVREVLLASSIGMSWSTSSPRETTFNLLLGGRDRVLISSHSTHFPTCVS